MNEDKVSDIQRKVDPEARGMSVTEWRVKYGTRTLTDAEIENRFGMTNKEWLKQWRSKQEPKKKGKQ